MSERELTPRQREVLLKLAFPGATGDLDKNDRDVAVRMSWRRPPLTKRHATGYRVVRWGLTDAGREAAERLLGR